MKARGSRAEVMHSVAARTSGGLTKNDLKYNAAGKIVSVRMSNAAKKNDRLADYSHKRFKKGQRNGRAQKGGCHKCHKGDGWMSTAGSALEAAGVGTAASGFGAPATPFLEAGGALLQLGDAIF